MPRGNIFGVEKLTLDYNGDYFVLKKNDNDLGSNYDVRGANNLSKTIQQEMQKTEHQMDYKLKEFNITPEAKKISKKWAGSKKR